MSTAAKTVQARGLSEVLTEAVRNKATVKARQEVSPQDKKFESISANTFHKIMFSEESTPEQKKSEIAKALAYEGTKEENKAKLKEFEMFKEYLQYVREEMAQEIIRLTDTEAFSELKQVYDELNTSLLDFDDKMRPLTEIIDAVYTLRTNGVTLDAFKEIMNDRRREEDVAEIRTEKERELSILRDTMDETSKQIASLGEDKAFFGLGGIRASAREQIARKQIDLDTAQSKLLDIETEVSQLGQQSQADTTLGEYAEQKKKLRELLDISTDEHKDRQKELVNAALHFVQTAKTRVGSVRDHLGKMNDQVEHLFDSNTKMSGVYAILTEGTKEAEQKNQVVRDALAATAEEDLITKMTREGKKMAVEQHITALDASAADTMSTYADLTSQTIRIKTMKDANDSQMAKARTMYSQGIAGVADRLSVVLQAVSGAALGESSAMAKETLSEMVNNTNLVAQKEAMRTAMGISDQNQDIIKAIDDLGAYGEVVRTATSITREGVTEMREKLNDLQRLAESVQGDISESIAVNADVGRGDTRKSKDKPKAATGPFHFGN